MRGNTQNRTRLCHRPHYGFTLIELLIITTILSITLGLTAAPLAKRIDELRSASAMRHLASLFSLARQEALLRQEAITVCALNTAKRCHRQWTDSHSIAVFIDSNNNRRLDVNDQLIRAIQWPLTGAELSWRASLARNHLRFEPNGGTWQNGTLYYCPKSRDARQARALVISHSGRNYLPSDSNGDGIREDRQGRNLRC
ncbi:GspH/FimT family pseudopilin [Congregibacter sp.]|uniref:GspH/FimT family pseudopilin n=1 Tax=Congregibacter sp. TaxID=2744308 RepID=UPI003F6B3E12